MRLTDLTIALDPADSVSVSRDGDVIGIRSGDVLLEMPADMARELADELRQAVPERKADTSADDEWPCEPVEVGDRVVVKEVPGLPGLYDGDEGEVSFPAPFAEPNAIGVQVRARDARTREFGVGNLCFAVREWRRIPSGDAA